MITINRNNYEEYFLLYADGELDAATKLEVENFVQQNSDLAVELNMLMQTKSLPENVVFNDKELLLRTEGNNINETNYEEYFLLYIDNELSATKRSEVEKYVLQHPKLQDEFTTLKQAVLSPEIINYGDKKELYRTEKKRIIYLQPLRYLAAAIIIGACAVGVWMWQKSSDEIVVANVQPAQHQPTKQNNVAVKPVDSIQQHIQQPPSQQNTLAQQPVTNKEEKVVTKSSVVEKKADVIKQKEIIVAAHHPATQQEDKTHERINENNIVQQQKPVINKNDVVINTVKPDPADLIEKPVIVKQQGKTNDASATNSNDYKTYNVAYKEINTDNEDNSLHVGMLDLNKNKVKNLFKKAGRLFGNKSNNNSNDDGKLQVANFEIQTIKQ